MNQMEQHVLYGGKVKLDFDTFKHVYYANGKVTYGVTSIKDVINKPALISWAANKAAESFRNDVKPGASYDEIQLDGFLAKAKSAHRQFTKDAASIGQLVHDWISKYIYALSDSKPLPLEPVNEKAKQSIKAFIDFTQKHNVEVTSSERKIYSMTEDYAGTLDGEGYIDGKKCILDFKTSSGIYPEFFIQVAAYLYAREEETGSKYEGAVIIRIDKETGEFEAKAIKREDLDEYYQAFLACLTLYRWQMRRKDEEKKNRESQLTLNGAS